MEDKNELLLIGTVTSDIILRTSVKGTPWLSFNINTDCNGSKHSNNVMAFKERATDLSKLIRKGDKIKVLANVGVSKNPKTQIWNTNIVVFKYELCPNDPGNTPIQKKMETPEEAKAEVPSEESLPF